MDNLHKKPSFFESIIGSVANVTPSNVDNDFDKTIGEVGEGMSASDFAIKVDGEIIFLLAYKFLRFCKRKSRMSIIKQRLRCPR